MPTLPSNKIHGSNSAINEGARRIQDGPLFFVWCLFGKIPGYSLKIFRKMIIIGKKCFF